MAQRGRKPTPTAIKELEGNPGKEPILWKLVINIGKVLAFDPAHTNPNSPANGDAASDWKAKQSGIRKHYPCGNINFPHPAGY